MGSGVFTVVNVRNKIFWNIMLCSFVPFYQITWRSIFLAYQYQAIEHSKQTQVGYSSFRTSSLVLKNLLGYVFHEIIHTVDILGSFAYLTNPIKEKRIITCHNYDLRSHTKHIKLTVKYVVHSSSKVS